VDFSPFGCGDEEKNPKAPIGIRYLAKHTVSYHRSFPQRETITTINCKVFHKMEAGDSKVSTEYSGVRRGGKTSSVPGNGAKHQKHDYTMWQQRSKQTGFCPPSK
jgi:hypothetical protein